ncbi:CLUMA_CG002517, isoform A [Clunio marinus]|uniref:CLUMA_CG002517, isoform A n=1 Tax=Clunio marinus TaxID=568069 RepID=A0A1J1HLF4_9DIPT|nr:CLUMA_CG002517, isoform A [Clunio marinus]
MIVLRSFLVFLAVFYVTEGLNIQCSYSIREVWMFPYLYTCEGQTIMNGSYNDFAPYFIEEVSQNHIGDKSDKSVKALLIENSKIKFLPKNIGQFFYNLESLSVIDCDILELNREDFVGLPNLLQIDFRGNKIDRLPWRVFEEVPKLQVIGLAWNPMKYIAHHVFDHLIDLETLDMFGTDRCYNKKFKQNKSAIASELYEIFRQCPPTIEMMIVELGYDDLVKKVNQCVKKLDEISTQ